MTNGKVAVALLAGVLAIPAVAMAEVPDNPTFHKDIEPILQRSCQVCHRPNNMAPMSLMSYQETRPWARSIRAKVEAREMPPWHIDPKVGVQGFKNDKSLSEDEILTIGGWVDNGAPRGNPEDAPTAVEFQEFGAWTIDPDVIVTSPAHTVPAEAGDWWGDYIVPSGISTDRYIKAIQTKAGDLRVVHHALTYAVTDADAPLNDSREDAFLNEYAVGKNADVYPDGSGRLLPADSRVRFSFHYHSVGEEVTDQTELGLVLYPENEEPERILYSRQLGQAGELDIPAGQVTRHDGYQKMYLPGKLTAFQPHMHFLGTRQCLELIYPNGSTEMVNCANFDFNWHIVYNYENDRQPVYPAGTTLHVISYHDNTQANRGNHDAKNWTGGGSRTVDEMAFAWISWHDMTDEEYAAELEARKTQTDND
ncbi:MAG: hypothetical protein VX453_14495 [Acidobacteriota bacterium]|nr:hypothetical protein [Acidobacteriota bacterium]